VCAAAKCAKASSLPQSAVETRSVLVGGPVHSPATSVHQEQFAPMDRLSVAVQPLWLVLRCAPEADQYVIRPAQRTRSAWKVRRGNRHSANQYVLRAARKATVSVRPPVTVVVTSAPPLELLLGLWVVAPSAPPQTHPRLRAASTLRRVPTQSSLRVHRPAHNRLNRKLNFLETPQGVENSPPIGV